MTEEAKPTTAKPAQRQAEPHFITKIRGKKVTIRLVSGSHPIAGTIEKYNPYEILIQTAKGPVLVFKHTIAFMEPVDLPKSQDFTLRE